jgi:hypothetical protein
MIRVVREIREANWKSRCWASGMPGSMLERSFYISLYLPSRFHFPARNSGNFDQWNR